MFTERKLTVWRYDHIVVAAENKEEAITKAVAGNGRILEDEIFYDSETPMTLKENNGYSTIEVCDSNNKTVYTNCIRKKKW